MTSTENGNKSNQRWLAQYELVSDDSTVTFDGKWHSGA